MNTFKDIGINTLSNCFTGDKIKITKILNKDIIIRNYKIEESKYPKNKSGKCLYLQFEIDGENKLLFTGSDVLIRTISQVKQDDLPIFSKIIQEGEHYEFK